MKITYKQFIETVENCIDCDGYFNRGGEELKIIEEVLGVHFEDIKDEGLKGYLFGLQHMHGVEKEKYLLFEDDED